MDDLGYGAATFTSPEGYYTIRFNAALPSTVTTYLIEAIPIAPQTADTDCYGFYLDHFGVKSNREADGTTVINNDRCW